MNDLNPVVIGPGYWDVIHRLSFNAYDTTSQKNFIKVLYEICSFFPCPICKTHFKKYLDENDVYFYVDKTFFVGDRKKTNSLFIYTWKFHNSVNARLNKPLLDFESAYFLYENNKNCSNSCKLSR